MMPFPGGLEDPANATLLFSVATAFLYATMLDRPPSRRRTLAKAGSVVLLAFLAAVQGGPILLVIALILSAAGDALLAQEGEKAFLGGLGSFLLAHLAYVVLFATHGSGAGIVTGEPWRLAAAIAMTGFAGGMFLRLRPALPSGLLAPVALYVLAILGMGLSTLALTMPLVIAGAILFMASDGILATERFLLPADSPHRRWTRPAVWVLYYLAQAAITLGFLLSAQAQNP